MKVRQPFCFPLCLFSLRQCTYILIGKVTLGAGILNCVLDLLVTTLPIPMVMRLQMRRRQQMGVIFLLSLGFIVTIAGIVR
jgi:hypothetical protein